MGVAQGDNQIAVLILSDTVGGRDAFSDQVSMVRGGGRHFFPLAGQGGGHTGKVCLLLLFPVPALLCLQRFLADGVGGVPGEAAGGGPVHLAFTGAVVLIPACRAAIEITPIHPRFFTVGIFLRGHPVHFAVHMRKVTENEPGLFQNLSELFPGRQVCPHRDGITGGCVFRQPVFYPFQVRAVFRKPEFL